MIFWDVVLFVAVCLLSLIFLFLLAHFYRLFVLHCTDKVYGREESRSHWQEHLAVSFYKHRESRGLWKKNRGMELFSGRSTMTHWGTGRKVLHQSPGAFYKDLSCRKRKVEYKSLAQWGSAWLPSSILMRGQDTRKDVVCSVSADSHRKMLPKETRYAQVWRLDVPTHHQAIRLGLTPEDD